MSGTTSVEDGCRQARRTYSHYLTTPVGKIEKLRVPRDREGTFTTEVCEEFHRIKQGGIIWRLFGHDFVINANIANKKGYVKAVQRPLYYVRD